MLARISKDEIERMEKHGDYREKLEAFLEGLECREIADAIDNFSIDDFRKLGEIMAAKTKEKLLIANIGKE